MKLHNIIAVGLVALAGFSYAQQSAAKQTGLVALVADNKGKSGRVLVKGASGKDTYVYYDKSREQDMQRKTSTLGLFFLQSPADLVEAERALNARDLAAARTQLGAVKEKYKGFQGLDRNPSERAAVLELECAISQLDFAGLKGLVGSFPHKDWLGADDKAKLFAAEILAKACTGAAVADVEAEVKKLMGTEVGKALCGDCYGWLQYAIAYSTAAAIPAAELEGGISEANVAAANKAIDAYCQAGVASHGGTMELPIDAMTRAQALLWAMPGVKDYAAKAVPMGKEKWNAAPANFRDAVALAYMLKNVWGTANPTIDAAAKLYFNTQAGQE
ncbi:MAG: hypothetical protein IJN29_07830 [Akkermansia sp.]|nr:hypothetical protein [Akkermansia sp.]